MYPEEECLLYNMSALLTSLPMNRALDVTRLLLEETETVSCSKWSTFIRVAMGFILRSRLLIQPHICTGSGGNIWMKLTQS